jgi:hypothetical protein
MTMIWVVTGRRRRTGEGEMLNQFGAGNAGY